MSHSLCFSLNTVSFSARYTNSFSLGGRKLKKEYSRVNSDLFADTLISFDVWFQSERRHGSTRLPHQLMTGGCVHLLYVDSLRGKGGEGGGLVHGRMRR